MWHPAEDNFTGNVQDILDYEFENYSFKFTAESPVAQWGNRMFQRGFWLAGGSVSNQSKGRFIFISFLVFFITK